MVGFRRQAGQRWEPSEKVHICQQVQTVCKLPFSYLQNQTSCSSVTSRGQEILLHQSFVAVCWGGRGPKTRTARRTKLAAQREREVERELVLQRSWS